jgi:hypothetical protein
MKNPKIERGPNVSMPIRQPHTTITSGVRQVAAVGTGRRSPSVAAMQIPRRADHKRNVDVRAVVKTAGKSPPGEVNASAWKPQPATWPNFPLQCSVAD